MISTCVHTYSSLCFNLFISSPSCSRSAMLMHERISGGGDFKSPLVNTWVDFYSQSISLWRTPSSLPFELDLDFPGHWPEADPDVALDVRFIWKMNCAERIPGEDEPLWMCSSILFFFGATHAFKPLFSSTGSMWTRLKDLKVYTKTFEEWKPGSACQDWIRVYHLLCQQTIVFLKIRNLNRHGRTIQITPLLLKSSSTMCHGTVTLSWWTDQ